MREIQCAGNDENDNDNEMGWVASIISLSEIT